MNKLKKIFIMISMLLIGSATSTLMGAEKQEIPPSTKKERNQITAGNKLYEEGKYREAMQKYRKALDENPSSQIARYNLGMSEIRIGSNPNDTSQTAKNMLESGIKNMEQISNLGNRRPDLASLASYNLGNISFNSEDYQKAVEYYKKSLRLNPSDENARRNLRIAQLKIQNQDQDQNQDQNQDQQQDQQDQEKDKEQQQDQNQDQNQDQDQQDQQDKQNQDQQDQQQQPQSMNPQTAEQILNAIENKENQTRARVAGQNAEKSRQRNKNKRNW